MISFALFFYLLVFSSYLIFQKSFGIVHFLFVIIHLNLFFTFFSIYFAIYCCRLCRGLSTSVGHANEFRNPRQFGRENCFCKKYKFLALVWSFLPCRFVFSPVRLVNNAERRSTVWPNSSRINNSTRTFDIICKFHLFDFEFLFSFYFFVFNFVSFVAAICARRFSIGGKRSSLIHGFARNEEDFCTRFFTYCFWI